MFTTKELKVFDLDKIETGAIVEFYSNGQKFRGILSFVSLHSIIVLPIECNRLRYADGGVELTVDSVIAAQLKILLRGIDE